MGASSSEDVSWNIMGLLGGRDSALMGGSRVFCPVLTGPDIVYPRDDFRNFAENGAQKLMSRVVLCLLALCAIALAFEARTCVRVYDVWVPPRRTRVFMGGIDFSGRAEQWRWFVLWAESRGILLRVHRQSFSWSRPWFTSRPCFGCFLFCAAQLQQAGKCYCNDDPICLSNCKHASSTCYLACAHSPMGKKCTDACAMAEHACESVEERCPTGPGPVEPCKDCPSCRAACSTAYRTCRQQPHGGDHCMDSYTHCLAAPPAPCATLPGPAPTVRVACASGGASFTSP